MAKEELLQSFNLVALSMNLGVLQILYILPLHHSRALNLQASLNLLLSTMPFKLVSTSWCCMRINEDNAKKKFRERSEDKCLTDVCYFTFSYCEATTSKQTIHRAVQQRTQPHSKGSLDFALLSWELLSKLFRLLPLKKGD